MLVATAVANDARVLREARSLVGAGHTVHIIGKSVPEGWKPPAGITVSSEQTVRLFTARPGPRMSLPVRAARWLLLPEQRRVAFRKWQAAALADARERDFDIVHAHDFTALGIGRSLASERGVPLIYDSHEMWSEIRREQRPTPIEHRRELRQEREWGADAWAIITVGDRLAARMRERFGWRNIHVVRNTFPVTDDTPTAGPRAAIYAGRLGPQRDLTTVARASELVDLPITLQGPTDASWLRGFDPGKVRIVDPVPVADVDQHLRAAGISLVTLEETSGNQRMALPNKVFHAVSCGVPVVATDIGELGALVREFDLGATYTAGDPKSLARALTTVQDDHQRYSRNVLAAQSDLSWAVDERRLLDIYDRAGREVASVGQG